MSKVITQAELAELPERLRAHFVPLDRRAAGIAAGSVLALLVFSLTAYHLVFDAWLRANVAYATRYEYSGDPLWLLEQFWVGYAPTSWGGALVGALWAAATGFVIGWFAAFTRNVVLAAWIVYVRSRAQLRASREFLDQI